MARLLRDTMTSISAGKDSSSWKPLLVAWGLAIIVASVIVLASSGQNYMDLRLSEGGVKSFWRIVRWPAFYWYAWALMAPGIVWLARHYAFTRAAWPRALVVHLVGCVFFYTLHVGLQVLAMFLPFYQHIHDGFRDIVITHATWSVSFNVLIYWGIVGVTHAAIYYQHYRRRELKTMRLESELARAQLQALKMQLHPHFLFNTLHAISTLMYRDLQGADRMLARLSELLRQVLDSAHAQEIPLHKEVAFLEKYLEIEQIRFADRLTVTMDIDPAVKHAWVPNLILQPLVENAIKHGIAPRAAAGRIAIAAWAENDALHLCVVDDGPGSPEGGRMPQDGVGLANTRARLDQLYGTDYRMALRRSKPSGWTIELTLPLRLGTSRPTAQPATGPA